MSQFDDSGNGPNENKSFCSYLWNHICIRSNEKLLPCCSFKDYNMDLKLRDYTKDSKLDLNAAFNSEIMQELRRKSLNGERIEGCRNCYLREEKANGRSLRKFANRTYKPEYNSEYSDIENVTFLEIFISNKCNLKCLICAPDLSTPLAKDYYDLGITDSSSTKITSTDYTSMTPSLKSLKRIKFVGGEPLLDKNHLKFIKSFTPEQRSKITLEYATNCTFYPNDEIIELWHSFHFVNIMMSLDGMNRAAEYSRFPTKWPKVKDVALKYVDLKREYPSGFDIGINCTLSVLTIFDFDNFQNFVESELNQLSTGSGEDTFFVNVLTFPNHLSIKNLPDSIKQDLLKKYPESHRTSFFRALLKEEGNPEELKRLKGYLLSFDKLRNTNYEESIPELKDILKDLEIDDSWSKYLAPKDL